MVTVSFTDYMKKKQQGASAVAAPTSDRNQSTSSERMDFKQYMKKRTGKPLSYVDTPSLAASSAVAPEKKMYTQDEILSGYDSSYKEYSTYDSALSGVMKRLGATPENLWDALAQKHGATRGKSNKWFFSTQAQLDAYNADAKRLESLIANTNTAAGVVKGWSDEWGIYKTLQDTQDQLDSEAEIIRLSEIDSERKSLQSRTQAAVATTNNANRAKTVAGRSGDYAGTKAAQTEINGAHHTKMEAENRIAELGLEERQILDKQEFRFYRTAPSQADFAEYAKKGEQAWENPAELDKLKAQDFDFALAGGNISANGTSAERDLFHYIYGKYGIDRAKTYLYHWQNEKNREEGTAVADWVDSINTPVLREVLTYGYQAGAGVDNFLHSIPGYFTDERKPVHSSAYASQELRDRADAKKGVLSQVDKFLQTGFNTVGNMLPAILVGKGVGLAASGAGAAAGTAANLASAASSVSMGLSSAGNAYQQALREGYTQAQARTYGNLVGLSEAGLSMLISGVGSNIGLAEGKLLEKAAALDKPLMRVLATGAVRVGGELAEEELQLFVEPAIKSLVLGADYEAPGWREMAETAIVTAISTGLLEGTSVADARFDAVASAISGDIMENPAILDGLLDNAVSSFPDSKTAKIAAKLTKKRGEGSKVSETEVKKFLTAYHAESKAKHETQHAVDEAQGAKNAASGVTPEQLKAYAEVFRAAKKTMGQRGAAAIAENTDLTKSAPEYFKDFARAYNDGQKGEQSDNSGSLSQEQYTAAFEAGQADAKAGDTDGTVVQVAKDAGVDWKDDYVKSMDQEVAKRIDQLGKDLGVRVRFVDVVRPVKGKNGIVGTADGQYEGNEILVEKNNPNPELFIAGHEFTHRMQDLSPETYNSFVQAVLADKAYFARGGTGTVEGAITAKIAQYKLKGEALTRETAIDELVADYAGHLLTNETYLDSFMESHKENRTMLEKLRDLFHEFSLTIKGALGNKAAIAEQKLTQMLESSTQSAQEIREGKVQKNTASDGGGVKYALKNYSQHQIDNWKGSKKVIVYQDDTQLLQFVDRAKADGTYQQKVYFGIVDGALAARILRDTGYDFDGLNVTLRADSVRKVLRDHGNQQAEALMGQRAVTDTDFCLIPDVIGDPDNVKPGQYNGRNAALFEKTINGSKITVFAVDSGKSSLDLFVQTMYAGAKKGSVANLSNAAKAARSNTPTASVGTTSSTTITQNQAQSNTQHLNGKNSLKTDADLDDEINTIYQRGHAEGWTEEDMRDEVNLLVEQRLQEARDRYGVIPAGENPTRNVQVPKKTADNQKVSQTVRTILEAGATPEEIIPDVETLVADGDFSYEKHTDKQAISNAENTIRRVGWAQALSDWMGDVKSGTVSKKNTAMGWALYNNAANSGDVQTAITILDQMVAHQRSAAQALQATRILKKLSPETQLYQVQRSVENLQEELNERFGEKGGPELKVDEELAGRFMQANNQEERDAVLKDIYRDIGRQMPSTFRDKWNAWRYLAMLCNAPTHMRNIGGNAGFAPVVLIKDLTASAIEEAVYRVSGGRMERSKAFVGLGKSDRDLLSAAWEDYSTVQETAMNGGKYSDFANANRYIEEGRVIFKNKVLEKTRKGNSKALDVEDQWFFRPHYAAALAQYCKANGITASQIRSGVGMDWAHAYAVKEAQKATYRDTNAFSQAISELGRAVRPGRNPVRKGVGVAVEGTLPFRKTPANILVRGLEYSPAGFLKAVFWDVWQIKSGRKTAAEVIDSISAGLTGSGLLRLGIYLAAQGLVRGHGGDDEDEIEFEELMGHQAYALELPDGTSVTLDWLAPEALPFFVGVNLWEHTGGERTTLADWIRAAATVTEPMLEMSCLQSLNDVFDAVGYAQSGGLDGLPAALATMVTSYLTQALPTLLGQAERSAEDTRMSTYTEKNAFLTSDMQYTIGRASARLPGWDYQQIPYIDAWGRTESTGNAAERAGNNFLNPAYTSTVETSPMEDELLRLYEQTGEAGVLPSRATKYFNADGERKDLTAQEYVKYAQAKGQTAYKVLTALTGLDAYRSMSDTEKVEAVGLVYDYANATAKTKVSGYKPEGWIAKAVKTEKATGVKAEQYVTLYLAQKDIESLKDADGDTIANSKSLLVMEMVYNVKGLTDAQRRALFEDFGVGKTVIHWNKALVQQKLKAMRKKAA